MRRLLLTPIFLVISIIGCYSQNHVKLTQFFQSPQLYNPAFTGVEPFLDLKFGRKQNLGAYEFAPKTTFFSVNAPINASPVNRAKAYSLRISRPDLYDKLQKSSFQILNHGIGAFYVNENQNAFTQQRFQLSYALHMGLNDKLKLSVAASPYFFNNRVDLGEIQFEVNPDPMYAQYSNIAYTRYGVNFGGLLYSNQFYVGYSVLDIVKSSLSVSENIGEDSTLLKENMGHRFMSGVRFKINGNFDLMPGVLLTVTPSRPIIYNFNAKVRYREQYWAGLSYQTSGTLSLVTGGAINNWLSIGYSYDYTIRGISNYVSGSHELVVGIMLLRNNFSKPYLW